MLLYSKYPATLVCSEEEKKKKKKKKKKLKIPVLL
jgi:hypothetical protein